MENENQTETTSFEFLDSVNIPDPLSSMSEEERKKIAAMIFYASGNREAMTHDDPLVWILAANRATGLEQLRLKKELDEQHIRNMQRLFEYQAQQCKQLMGELEAQREKLKNLLAVSVNLTQEIADQNANMGEILNGYDTIVASVKDAIVLNAEQQIAADTKEPPASGLAGVFKLNKS